VEDKDPVECFVGTPLLVSCDLCTLDRMRLSKSLLKLHPRALRLMLGMAVSHSNGRQQRAKEASLVRLVIRVRQVRGGRVDLVQGNGILSCVG
jgi:hypothetical protein